jgi:LacI family repressor for deo operon, udp, cdd, tsx, nupC, and nupG
MTDEKRIGGPDTGGASMKQVAERAGVAVSTVSRALANPGRVNEKTRTRILEAAAALGYTPNAAARSLRSGRTNVVMIVLPGQLFYGASQVIPLVLAGIDKALSEQGYNLLIGNLDREAPTETHILDLATNGSADAAIVISSDLPRVEGRSLADCGLPLAALMNDLSPSGVPSVLTNEREMTCLVAEDMIASGHERFFYVAGPNGAYHEDVRFGGIEAAMTKAGLPLTQLHRSSGSVPYNEGFRMGDEAADEFMALSPRPTGVLCTSDDAALGFIRRVQARGLSVPKDVAVAGFDGSAVGALFTPALSTISQPAEDMGVCVAKLVLDQLNGEEVPAVSILPSTYIKRASS